MTPMLVLLLAGARGIEKLSARIITGDAVSLAGVVLLRALDSGPQGAATFLGDFLTFCGALAFAIFTVLGKPTAKHYGSITVNTVAYVGGAILLAPVTLWQAARFPLAGIPWSGWAAVFYMALVPSVVCYLIYYYALAHMEASRLSAFNYLLPPLGMITGVWLLGEHVTLWTMLGAAVIFGGIYLVESTR
jgi:drug/metabolite transporter (DMT)-like permease